ncbi:uncharacterized protein [Henckelia pumila]|uniref:uncharacterized protein n=1 Tax=Henckelia pumila TaxID=405737 RepID=UPI003C6E1A5F
MRRPLFFKIVEDIQTNVPYFVQRRDTTGKLGFSSLQKITAAVRMLAYDVAGDAVDEYLRIGCNNDINVLERSNLFLNLAKEEAPLVQFEVNENEYNMIFARYQEGVRKDVERAFGILQARWHIVRGSSRLWDPIDLDYIMKTCIILHKMIVEDEREDILEDHDFPARDDEHVPPNVERAFGVLQAR